MPANESPECDARVDEAIQLPLPTWQMEEAPNWETDWLSTGEEAETILAEGDKDLDCPPQLEPFLQELLGGEESSLTEVEGRLVPLPQSTPEDLELSLLHHAE